VHRAPPLPSTPFSHDGHADAGGRARTTAAPGIELIVPAASSWTSQKSLDGCVGGRCTRAAVTAGLRGLLLRCNLGSGMLVRRDRSAASLPRQAREATSPSRDRARRPTGRSSHAPQARLRPGPTAMITAKGWDTLRPVGASRVLEEKCRRSGRKISLHVPRTPTKPHPGIGSTAPPSGRRPSQLGNAQ